MQISKINQLNIIRKQIRRHYWRRCYGNNSDIQVILLKGGRDLTILTVSRLTLTTPLTRLPVQEGPLTSQTEEFHQPTVTKCRYKNGNRSSHLTKALQVDYACFSLRRLTAAPIRPTPAKNIAYVSGSGTAATCVIDQFVGTFSYSRL